MKISTASLEVILFLVPFLCLNSSAQNSAFVYENSNASNHMCETPDGQMGVCINVMDCAEAVNHLDENAFNSSINRWRFFVKNSCGFNGSSPLFCCISKSNSTASAEEISMEVNVTLVVNTTMEDDVAVTMESRSVRTENCGIQPASLQLHSRIVGGTVSLLNSWPWMAGIHIKKLDVNFVTSVVDCGGVLIDRNYVLTAAHCTDGNQAYGDISNGYLQPSHMLVRLGDHDLTSEEEGAHPVNVEVTQIVRHPEYSFNGSSQYKNDLALLRLNVSADMSMQLFPAVCLPWTFSDINNGTLDDGDNVTAIGWGHTDQGKPSPQLLEVALQVINTTTCSRSYQQRLRLQIPLDQAHLCAGALTGRLRDTCNRDSGGPLMSAFVDDAGHQRWMAVGIVAFGSDRCGDRRFPGVYTRISEYADWILSSMTVAT